MTSGVIWYGSFLDLINDINMLMTKYGKESRQNLIDLKGVSLCRNGGMLEYDCTALNGNWLEKHSINAVHLPF